MYPSDFTACSWQRCWFPGYWLRKLGLARVHFVYGPEVHEAEWAQISVYQRWVDEDRPFAWWRELGKTRKPRVYELDDDFFCLPKSNPFVRYYTPEKLLAAKTMIREADLVTCSTQALANSMSRFNKKVAVLPNGIDPDALRLPVAEFPDQVRIAFMGSRTHDEDFAVALPALKRVVSRHPQVRMIFAGDPPTGVPKQFPPEQTEVYGWVDFEELYPFLASLGLDVVVAPLTRHPFNWSKSAIKYVESASLGAVCIASPVGGFAEQCRDGETALLPKTEGEWEDALELVVTNEKWRREMAALAKDDVAKRLTYDVLARRWAAAYAELLDGG